MTIDSRITLLDLPFEPRVWLLDLTDPVGAADEVNWLSDSESARAAEFTDPLLAARFRLRRGLARLAICETLEMDTAAIPLAANRLGQPQLPGWNISFSNSGDYGLVALSSVPVGVDLELVKPIDYELLLLDHFTETERDQVRNAHDSLKAFYEGWTRKEAVAKAVGTGVAESLVAYSSVATTELAHTRYESANFPAKPDYVAALSRLN